MKTNKKTLQGWNVYRGRILVDTIYFQVGMSKDEVLESLTGHDGYWDGIKISKDY